MKVVLERDAKQPMVVIPAVAQDTAFDSESNLLDGLDSWAYDEFGGLLRSGQPVLQAERTWPCNHVLPATPDNRSPVSINITFSLRPCELRDLSIFSPTGQ